jgi:hypothetical protein
LGGWLQREQTDVIAFLREENRILKAPPGSDCVSMAVSAGGWRKWGKCGRRMLAQVATW